MEDNKNITELTEIASLATQYCVTLENASEFEKGDFTARMCLLLPRIYLALLEHIPEVPAQEDELYGSASYLDEDYYESIRRRLEALFGEDDMFLETFEDDMKYSDTPIAVSMAESLSDIFQALYNFAAVVRDTGADGIERAYAVLYANFCEYWAQRLVNVLRPLNALYLAKGIES